MFTMWRRSEWCQAEHEWSNQKETGPIRASESVDFIGSRWIPESTLESLISLAAASPPNLISCHLHADKMLDLNKHWDSISSIDIVLNDH